MPDSHPGLHRPRGQRGISYVELIVACAVLLVLAAAAMPLARWDEKRRLEGHLRVHLQTMRDAIDRYKTYCDEGLILQEDVEQMCYPPELETLAEEIEIGDPADPRRIRILRRIPVDPFTGEDRWGMRSYQDDWDSDNWGGENLYDVYSLSDVRALDGTYYSEW